jgi:hypothetical protein
MPERGLARFAPQVVGWVRARYEVGGQVGPFRLLVPRR